jgi:hypothetical protein
VVEDVLNQGDDRSLVEVDKERGGSVCDSRMTFDVEGKSAEGSPASAPAIPTRRPSPRRRRGRRATP